MDIVADWPIFEDDVDWEQAQASLEDAGLSDGLPLVAPTKRRLAAMLDAVAGPQHSHGPMPPLFQELTNAAVAYNCVLAGCQPAALPVAVTAAVACLDPSVNLLGAATTTGAAAIATVVHGPIASTLALNAGVNCLGPGSRGNAALGRSIALVLRNIAGMAAGNADMATLGQPAKYGLCFAEASDATFAPLHVRQGLPAAASAVTVLAISGTVEVLPSQETGNWDTPENILDPAALAMHATTRAGGGHANPESKQQVLLLPPELAQLIARRGWAIADIQRHLAKQISMADDGAVAARPQDVHVIVTGGPGNKMAVLPLWGGGTRAITRELIQL